MAAAHELALRARRPVRWGTAMKLTESLETSVAAWLMRRRNERLLQRFGGIQTCCWCRQCAQSNDGWSFATWDRDPFLDVLTCSVCGGTSLYHFGLGTQWIAPLSPPSPAWPAVEYYAAGRTTLQENDRHE